MMRQLSRNTKPLLKTVAGRRHATDEDHERDPESSSDEAEPPQPNGKPVNTLESVPVTSPRGTKRKVVAKKELPELKRPKSGEELEMDPILRVVPNRKASRASYRKSFKNPHAITPKDVKNTLNGSTKTNKSNIFKQPPQNGDSFSKRPSAAWKSPPNSSPVSSNCSENRPFQLPPDLPSSTDLFLVRNSFEQPPAASFHPTTRSGRKSRSTFKDITPEPSQPITIFGSPSEQLPETDTNVGACCPTCNASVPDDLLAIWKAQYPKMNIRIQQRFCREHNLLSAKGAWAEQHPNHPTVIDIDWDTLDQRLQNRRNEMVWLIERPEKSYFRQQFQQAVVDKGGSRTLLKQIVGRKSRTSGAADGTTEEDAPENATVSVGYYGTRGLKKMYVTKYQSMNHSLTLLIRMVFITQEFSAILRGQIGIDKLIAARDVSGYIQMVLAPELASRLIMDDMDTTIIQAREVMVESASLGDLLYGSTEEDGGSHEFKRIDL
jgi:RTC4-like domain